MDIKQEIQTTKLIIAMLTQTFLVFFCGILALLLSQFLVDYTLVVSNLPSDFSNLNEEDKKIVYQQEVEQYRKDFQENPQKIIEKYYSYVIKQAPWMLFIERLLWMFAFLPPAYFFIHRVLRNPLPNFSSKPLNQDVLLSLVFSFLIFISINMFFTFLMKMGYKVEMNAANKVIIKEIKGNLLGYLWALYSIGIITGIIEEVFFRGYLLNQFIHLGQPKLGLIFTSVIFGFMHHSPNASFLITISLCFVGLAFGFIYIKTKNIWATSLCHITYNSLVLTVGYFWGDIS